MGRDNWIRTEQTNNGCRSFQTLATATSQHRPRAKEKAEEMVLLRHKGGQSYEVRGSSVGAEIIKDTGTTRNRTWCREDVEKNTTYSFLWPSNFLPARPLLQKSSL